MYGERIKKAIAYRKINQAELARRIDKDPMTVSDWANDKVVPSTDSIAAIAIALKISADYLLGLVGDENFHGHLSLDDLEPEDWALLAARDGSTPYERMRRALDVLEKDDQQAARPARRSGRKKLPPKGDQK